MISLIWDFCRLVYYLISYVIHVIYAFLWFLFIAITIPIWAPVFVFMRYNFSKEEMNKFFNVVDECKKEDDEYKKKYEEMI